MKLPVIFSSFFIILTVITFPGCGQLASQDKKTPVANGQSLDIPPRMHLVEPVSSSKNKKMQTSSSSSRQAPPREEPRIQQGNFFSYALPPGWRVGENGQYALTLVAPDNRAMTVMVGNSGLMPNYSPGQFVYEKLMSLRPSGLSISDGSNTHPVTGFQEAYKFKVNYNLPSGNYSGEAICHVSRYYGGCVMAMTAALSESSQWSSYASWLPQVSRQISATNGAAFGMRGVMQQNLQNSIAFGEALKAYRSWSQENWRQVTDERDKTIGRQNSEFRENLGGVQTYSNPYDAQRPVELPAKYKYYWMDQQGKILGTDDPLVNPNEGSTFEWRKMQTQETR